MPNENPRFVPDLANLVDESNLICYDEGDGHRFRWGSTGITTYPVVGGALMAINHATPWKLTVFPKRGTKPWDQVEIAMSFYEDPDDPDKWIIEPIATAVRQTDLHESNPRVQSQGLLSVEDFYELALEIVRRRLTPGQAWVLLEPKLLPPA